MSFIYYMGKELVKFLTHSLHRSHFFNLLRQFFPVYRFIVFAYTAHRLAESRCVVHMADKASAVYIGIFRHGVGCYNRYARAHCLKQNKSLCLAACGQNKAVALVKQFSNLCLAQHAEYFYLI